MIRRQTVLMVFGFALIVLMSGAHVGRAAFNDLTDGDASSASAKYKEEHSSGAVVYTAADVGNQHGTIKITDTWANGDCTPHKITFMQRELPPINPADPAEGFGTSEGLRLQVELMITNQSGKPWSGFWIKTDDGSVPANLDPSIGGGGSHDHKAHFHPNSATPPPGPPMVTGMPVTGFMTPANSDINNATMFMVGGGMHNSGDTFNMKNFFLHERNLKKAADPNAMPPTPVMAVIRTFDLILMPHCVPEPASLLQMIVGYVGVTWGWRRYGKRAAR